VKSPSSFLNHFFFVSRLIFVFLCLGIFFGLHSSFAEVGCFSELLFCFFS